jgi:hypothetical protein
MCAAASNTCCPRPPSPTTTDRVRLCLSTRERLQEAEALNWLLDAVPGSRQVGPRRRP